MAEWKDELGPGLHNPCFGMFTDEIIITESMPCILGLTKEQIEENRRITEEENNNAC